MPLLSLNNRSNVGQPIRIIESPLLQHVLHLLHPELKGRDIPGRTKLRNHIGKMYEEHKKKLQEDMKAGNMCPFMFFSQGLLLRELLEKSPLLLIHGQIQIKMASWLSQPTGWKKLRRR